LKKYIKIVEKIIQDIENNDQLEIINKDYRLNYEDKEDIMFYFQEQGYSLCESLLNFYSQIQLIDISWKLVEHHNLLSLDDNAISVMGRINILPYHIMLNGKGDDDNWRGTIWFDEEEEGAKRALKKLKPFDYFYNDDSGCICALVKAHKIIDDFKLFGDEAGLIETKLNLDRYIKLLAKSRGFLMWQEIVVIKNNPLLEEYNFYMKQLFDNYQLEFEV